MSTTRGICIYRETTTTKGGGTPSYRKSAAAFPLSHQGNGARAMYVSGDIIQGLDVLILEEDVGRVVRLPGGQGGSGVGITKGGREGGRKGIPK